MHEHGGTGYQITRLAIRNPIITSTLTRNGVTEVIKRKMTPINVNVVRRTTPRVEGVRTPLSSVILRDLDYVVEFYIDFPDGNFERNDGDEKLTYRGKFEEMLMKRLEVGSCYHPPYFGCREWTANFDLATEKDMIIKTPTVPNMTIPLMLYERLNPETLKVSPTFSPITLKDGIVTYPTWEQVKNQ
jgi:CRISPR-associated protein Cas5d